MMTGERTLVSKRAGLLLALLLFPSSAFSAQISDIQYDLFWGDAFTAVDQKFLISEDYSGDSDIVSGIMLAVGDGVLYNYQIRGGSVVIAPSQLLEDFSDSGVAGGYFASGATITISGSIWQNSVGGWQKRFDAGALITGTVQLSFPVIEEGGSPDTLYSQLDIHVTGGELLNGTNAGLSLVDNHLVADISLLFCAQNGGGVENFASGTDRYNISYGSGSGMQMYAAPEPVTISLLGLGSLLALRMRKR